MSGPVRSSHRPAIALALLVTFLWSTSWILIRWGLDDEELAPLGFAAMRYGLAAAVLLGWVITRPSGDARCRPSTGRSGSGSVGWVSSWSL